MAPKLQFLITAKNMTAGAFTSAGGGLTRLGSVAKGIGSGIAKIFKVLTVAALAATAAIVAFSVKTVKAFTVQEDAEIALTAAIEAQGGAVDELLPKLKKQAIAIQDVTTFGDEAILGQQAFGLNLGITTDKLEEATVAAVGLAGKFKLDLATSMMLVGRASQGQTQMLTRYGIILDDTLDDQGKFNALLKIGAANFGLAEKAAKSTSGRFTQLRNKLGDMFEAFGSAIVETLGLNDAFDKLKDRIADFIASGQIEKWAAKIKPIIDSIATTISQLFGDKGDREIALGKIKDLGMDMAQAFVKFVLFEAVGIGVKIGTGILKGMAKEAIPKILTKGLFPDLPSFIVKKLRGKTSATPTGGGGLGPGGEFMGSGMDQLIAGQKEQTEEIKGLKLPSSGG